MTCHYCRGRWVAPASAGALHSFGDSNGMAETGYFAAGFRFVLQGEEWNAERL